MAVRAGTSDTLVTTLRNGVRVAVQPLPHAGTAAVSVFVRSGSLHESAGNSGISHFIEHMAFKGTRSRDCQQINLDAERLGADVNAHTDQGHTAFHMRGLNRDAGALVRMLGDIVRDSTFPDDEIGRERKVILQEHAEDEDDPMSTAFKLFDHACYGEHAIARPVIGSRANLRRFTRAELVAFVAQQYTGVNIVVGVAGHVDVDAVVAEADAAFGDMPRGHDNQVTAPHFLGGSRARQMAGSSQVHAVLGFPLPGLLDDYQRGVIAAALFGEGMSSPLLDQIRERRGLVYHADCTADVTDLCGRFVIESSMAPKHLDEYLTEVTRLLREHADTVDAVDLERARNQIIVRSLCAQEDPVQRIEAAALDLFTFGRVRGREELLAGYAAVTPAQVRDTFAQMQRAGPAVAVAGKIGRRAKEQVALRVGASAG